MDSFSLVHILRLLLLLNALIVLKCQVEVVNSDNLGKATSKLFSVLYLYPKGCFRCRELYPKFLQAFQTFQFDKDIYFCKVKSRKLMKTMNVTTFPSIVYYHAGDKRPDRYRGEFTVDDLIGLVQHTVQGDFNSVKRRYVVELTGDNFRTVVYIPTQHTMILVYYEEDEDLFDEFETVAEAFKREEKIVFCRLDANLGQSLSMLYNAPEYPAIYWYEKGKIKDKKRYGGPFGVEELIDFVNDKAGFERQKGGELSETAGRIESLDRLVQQFIDELRSGDNLKSFLEDVGAAAALVTDKKRYADYYVYLMEEIVEGGTANILHDSRSDVIWKLSHGELSTSHKEDLTRKKNILDIFIQEISLLMEDDQFAKMEEYAKKKQKEKGKKKATKKKKIKTAQLMKTEKKPHVHEEL